MRGSLKLIQAILILLVFILSGRPGYCQNPDWARFYPLPLRYQGWFNDVYRTTDGGFAFGGRLDTIGMTPLAGYWLLKTDTEGEVQIDKHYQPGIWNSAACYSLIQCDDGGYLLGGFVDDTAGYGNRIEIIRTDRRGNQQWILPGPEATECWAVIESKDGGYVACGRINVSEGYVMRFDDDANVVWEHRYGREISTRFSTIREVDGGYLLGGACDANGSRASLVKIDDDGQVVWQNQYDFPIIYALISCRSGGFAATGGYSDWGVEEGTAQLLRVDDDGNQEWLRGYFANMYAMSLTEISDGFIVAGSHLLPELTRTDLNGDSIWYRAFTPQEHIAGSFYSVISDQDDAVYFAGGSLRDGVYGGVCIKLTPERLAPIITEKEPLNDEFEVLQGDSIRFSISVIDLQGDSLSYFWSINGEEYNRDTISTSEASIEFSELGTDTIKAYVWDYSGSDSATWHVTVTDLYISAFTPDTLDLTIRRGSSADFSIDTVRYTDGAPPEYLWTVTNLDNRHQEEAGRDALLHYQFNQSGNYSVEGLVYRGESSDAVTWNVSVRGAIWAFTPEELTFEVLPESLIQFDVLPTVPDAEGQTICWLVDGEVVAEDTTLLQWSFGSVDNFPRYLAQVQVVVADTVESDTVSWEVTVREPDGVGDKRDAYPTRMELLSVSPNPFNSTLTIRFDVGARHAVPLQIAIYDISGRMVAVIPAVTSPQVTDEMNAATRSGAAAENSVVWDASSIPAGVYFVRLQSGREIATKKVVLMK